MGPYEKKLREFDRCYSFSDDYSVWKKGKQEEERLIETHKKFKCPFSFIEVLQWTDGQTIKNKQEIINWFKENDK